ncbi:MAG: type I-G CRISPR-associated protein Csb2 [Nocardioides sp.]
MALVIDMLLMSGRYDAGGGQDPREVEWPPHPARVFSAFRSVATDDEVAVLRDLERLAPPLVHASGVLSETGTRAYVVTNTLAAKGGNLTHLGRTSGLRQRRSVFPVSPRVQMVWTEDGDVSDTGVAQLDELARRVPYLGRSTSLVMMSARRVAQVEVPAAMDAYEPAGDEPVDVSLRVPYRGYVDALEALHHDASPAWQASDDGRAAHPYRLIPSDGDASSGTDKMDGPPHASPYRDLVVLRFIDHRPAGRLTPVLAAALRSRVMSRTAEPLPPAVHGHGLQGTPHVAYLGLPVCGNPHADGHLVAMAVAIPGMAPDERARVLRGILGSAKGAKIEIDGPRIPTISLVYEPDSLRPRAALAATWQGPSRQWVSATPVVVDRFPKDGDLGAAVAHSFTLAGLPEPVRVQVSKSALATGGVHLRPQELPKRSRGRLYCHARVWFDREVVGPVLVGAGRYFGVGLFSPEFPSRDGVANAS